MRTLVLVGLLCFAPLARATVPTPVDLLLVAANDELLQPLIERLEEPQIENHAAWTIWTGKLSGKSVALTRSEGDPLNAVAATTLAIRFHSPRLIVTYGIARAHDSSLQPGDVVISEKFAAFDGMVSPQKPLGGGSDPQQWDKLPHLLMAAGENEVPMETFPADKSAAAVAFALSSAAVSAHIGTLGSAAQINREADRVAWLHEHWNTSTEDGESAHIAGCATLFHVPVIGIRVVNGPPNQVSEFTSRFVKAWK